MPRIELNELQKKQVSFITNRFRKIVREKGIKAKITGKRLYSIVAHLIAEKGINYDDLYLIIDSLAAGEEFEMYMLANDEYFKTRLEGAKKLEMKGLISPHKKDYKRIMQLFVEQHIKPYVDAIKEGKITYVELLLSTPPTVNGALEWMAVDIPLVLSLKYELVKKPELWSPEVLKKLSDIRRKSSLRKRLEEYYLQILKECRIIYNIVLENAWLIKDFLLSGERCNRVESCLKYFEKVGLNKLEHLMYAE